MRRNEAGDRDRRRRVVVDRGQVAGGVVVVAPGLTAGPGLDHALQPSCGIVGIVDRVGRQRCRCPWRGFNCLTGRGLRPGHHQHDSQTHDERTTQSRHDPPKKTRNEPVPNYRKRHRELSSKLRTQTGGKLDQHRRSAQDRPFRPACSQGQNYCPRTPLNRDKADNHCRQSPSVTRMCHDFRPTALHYRNSLFSCWLFAKPADCRAVTSPRRQGAVLREASIRRRRLTRVEWCRSPSAGQGACGAMSISRSKCSKPRSGCRIVLCTEA